MWVLVGAGPGPATHATQHERRVITGARMNQARCVVNERAGSVDGEMQCRTKLVFVSGRGGCEKMQSKRARRGMWFVGSAGGHNADATATDVYPRIRRLIGSTRPLCWPQTDECSPAHLPTLPIRPITNAMLRGGSTIGALIAVACTAIQAWSSPSGRLALGSVDHVRYCAVQQPLIQPRAKPRGIAPAAA